MPIIYTHHKRASGVHHTSHSEVTAILLYMVIHLGYYLKPEKINVMF